MATVRRIRRRLSHTRPPGLNKYGSIQAYHALSAIAKKLGLDFHGRPTGVKQVGDMLFLYEDFGVGCFRPRIVRAVKPLHARDFTPEVAWAS